MKKKVLLLFICLFGFFYVDEVCYAADKLYFEADHFSSSDSLKTFVSNVCGGGNSVNTCHYTCKSMGGEYSTNSGDVSLCDGVGGVDKLWINNGLSSSLNSSLGGLSCDTSGTNCWQWVKDTYCKGYSSASKSSDYYKLCNSVKKTTDSGGDSSKRSCSYAMSMRGKSKTVSFTVSVPKKDTSKIAIGISSEGNDGSGLPSDGTYYTGYSNTFYFYSKGSDFATFSADFVKKYNESGCPRVYFCFDKKKSNDFGGGAQRSYAWYATLKKADCSSGTYLSDGTFQSTKGGTTTGVKTSSDGDVNGGLIDKTKAINILDCNTIFSDDSEELLKLLKWVFKAIQLLIPAVLIGLGTVDFVQAVFSGSEDKMKKAQTKFIKRLIIAVAIFLIPSVLKVILTIANGIWGSIDTDYCGLLN